MQTRNYADADADADVDADRIRTKSRMLPTPPLWLGRNESIKHNGKAL